MRRLLLLAVLTASLLIAMGGIALADAEVTIGDDELDPARVEVEVREAIVWTNASDDDVSLVGSSPKWESGPIEPGATFSIHITQEGTYTYESADGALSGEIVVGQADEGDGGSDTGDDGNGDDAEVGGGAGDDEGAVDEEVDPEDEALPRTGLNAALPGGLSVLLIAFGGGLLGVTQPRRRARL